MNELEKAIKTLLTIPKFKPMPDMDPYQSVSIVIRASLGILRIKKKMASKEDRASYDFDGWLRIGNRIYSVLEVSHGLRLPIEQAQAKIKETLDKELGSLKPCDWN